VETRTLSRSGSCRPQSGRFGRREKLLLLGLLAFASLMLVPARASAMGNPFTQNRVQALGGLRVGSNDLNFGLGLKAGYTLPMDLYVGGMFDYFFGEDYANTVGPTQYTGSFEIFLLAPEVGYDFGITPAFMVRPFGGIGLASVDAESCGQGPGISYCVDDSESDVLVTLGGLVHYSIGRVFFGGELRVLLYESEAVALGVHAGGAF
jgi:hypothetical protein